MSDRISASVSKLWGRGFWESRWAVQTSHGDQGSRNIFGVWESPISSLIQWRHLQHAKPQPPTSHPQVTSSEVRHLVPSPGKTNLCDKPKQSSGPSNNTCSFWEIPCELNGHFCYLSCTGTLSVLLSAINNTVLKCYLVRRESILWLQSTLM